MPDLGRESHLRRSMRVLAREFENRLEESALTASTNVNARALSTLAESRVNTY